MKRLFFSLIVSCWSGVAFAQYVSQALQQRINDDNYNIQRCTNVIASANADLQSIFNDQQANAVTANLVNPEVNISAVSLNVI